MIWTSTLSYAAKLNFKAAGPKLGAHVKQAAQMIASMPSADVKKFAAEGKLEFEDNGTRFTLTNEEIEVIRNEREGFAVENDAGVTIALVTELTEALTNEGVCAREIVNKIQNMRKTSGFDVTDRITVGSRLLRAPSGARRQNSRSLSAARLWLIRLRLPMLPLSKAARSGI